MACLILLAAVSGCSWVNRRGGDSRGIVASRGLSQRGISAIERQDWETAEVLLAEAVEVCGACPEARRYYAETLWHKGDRKNALAHMDAAIETAPQDPSLWIRRAEMQLEAGNVEAARLDSDTAIDLDPALASAWTIRGRIQHKAGDSAGALAAFHRALACDGSRLDVMLEVAEIYRETGEPQRALMSLQGVADRYSPGAEPARVHYLTGLALSALGRYDDAVVEYRLAAERGGPDPELCFRAAEALWLARRPDDARRVLSEALAMQPGHAPSQRLWEHIDLASRPADGPR